MIEPVSGSAQPELPQEPKFSQKRFDMQWEMDLISTFVAVTGKNGGIKHQLDSLKDELKKGGTSLDALTPHVNNLANQLGLPSFEGSQNFVKSVESVLKTAVGEEKTEAMMQALGQNPSINTVIEAANRVLPPAHQLQKLGDAALG